MNRNNTLIILSLLLMLIFVIISLRLFSRVEDEQQKNKKISDSLRVQLDSNQMLLDSNLTLQRKTDSLCTILYSLAVNKTAPAKDDSLHAIILNLKKVSESSAKLNDMPAFQQAANLEREAFTALLNNHFDSALNTFMEIERISPSYHMAYEISRLLKKNKDKFANTDTQKEIKKEIVTTMSWRAPTDLINQLKKQVDK